MTEKFVDESEAKRITGTIFIVIGCMGLATVLSFLLYWAYSTDKRLFSGVLWTIVFLYSVVNVTFVGVSKNRLKPLAFRFFIALHSSMALISMALFIFYYVRASKNMQAYGVGTYGYNTPSPASPMQIGLNDD